MAVESFLDVRTAPALMGESSLLTMSTAERRAHKDRSGAVSKQRPGESRSGVAMDVQENQKDYTALTTALELRFGDEHLWQVFGAQLKSRIQKSSESLQEFAAHVKRLVHLAYSEAPQDFQDRLVAETFVNGVRDSDVRRVLQISGFKKPSEALIRALEVDAAYNSSPRSNVKIRGIGVDGEVNPIQESFDKMSENFEKLVREIIAEIKTGSSRQHGGRLECYSADEEIAAATSSTSGAGKLKAVGNSGRVLAAKKEAPTTIMVRSIAGSVDSPTISGKINGRESKIIIDTGAEGSLARRSRLQNSQIKSVCTATNVKTVTGETIPVLGTAVVNVELGRLRIRVETNPGYSLGMVQPASDSIHKLLIVSTLVKTDRGIPLRVANVFPNAVNIRQGEIIGMCEPVARVLNCEEEDVENESKEGYTKGLGVKWDQLSVRERKLVKGLIRRHRNVFATEEEPFGKTNIVEHRINNGDTQPIRQATPSQTRRSYKTRG
ncbi:uncharacterized protein LOC135138681 [Zophobas morio]|uniref:uncharacterized protein LOC135138681 n=1 Tax=Zophobas morio TaxID=2755281 RepID=UPI003083ADE6